MVVYIKVFSKENICHFSQKNSFHIFYSFLDTQPEQPYKSKRVQKFTINLLLPTYSYIYHVNTGSGYLLDNPPQKITCSEALFHDDRWHKLWDIAAELDCP